MLPGFLIACFSLAFDVALADIYLHNPRGSNNRNCRNDNGETRRNGNRLFDSQNNAKGGYSCPRAYPFACYKETGEDKNECNSRNQNGDKSMVDENGDLVSTSATNTPRMYYFSGTMLPLEWTNQHGCGTNSKVHCEIVIQVACEDTLSDDCGDTNSGKTCYPRDGTPVNNNDGDNLNDEATSTIPDSADDQDDYRYGRHETFRYYQKCKNRERNKGLFIADQNINGKDARFTRQNNNGQRYGLECPEESEYWPYWAPSPWKDIAVLTSNTSRCDYLQAVSENVLPRYECRCSSDRCQGDGNLPNNERACVSAGGIWEQGQSHNIPAPECLPGAFTRDNHLGNAQGNGYASGYNWTIPSWLEKKDKCVLRIRYNISTGDGDDVSVFGDSRLNGDLSPIKDRNNNEEQVYKDVTNMGQLAFAINTNQYGRVFQDRSYIFSVKEPPAEGPCAGKTIHNLNVRGKRGNIVQAYPAVEYDFTPNVLTATEDECIHAQWTGSDYNPNRNPNNAEGGPPNPNNNNEAKADRSNLVEIASLRDNIPLLDPSQFSVFSIDTNQYRRLAFLDQPVDNAQSCLSLDALKEKYNNRDERERSHYNCAKLNAAETPYFDAGAIPAGRTGTHYIMSTRNNNFSNRGQKAIIHIKSRPAELSGAAIAGAVIGTLLAAGLAAAGGVYFYKKRKGISDSKNGISTTLPTYAPKKTSAAAATKPVEPRLPPPMASSGNKIVRATHDYVMKEAGELSFSAGDIITVLREDESGWWEGRLWDGTTGIFPGNYTKPENMAVVAA